MVIAIALVVAAPVLLSYGFYYFSPPGKFTNYGELLPTQPLPPVTGKQADGVPFDLARERGRWTVLVVAPATCDEACATTLYATRQARTIQGKESDRVVRVWLATGDGTPPPALLAEHPDLRVVRGADPTGLPKGPQAVYLVDPLGNQVLAWPRDPDIKAMAKDLGRLLKASRIG
jgi:cytochrome oxidase Cu insertion factor (SCO1/SenC/PrrC family)